MDGVIVHEGGGPALRGVSLEMAVTIARARRRAADAARRRRRAAATAATAPRAPPSPPRSPTRSSSRSRRRATRRSARSPCPPGPAAHWESWTMPGDGRVISSDLHSHDFVRVLVALATDAECGLADAAAGLTRARTRTAGRALETPRLGGVRLARSAAAKPPSAAELEAHVRSNLAAAGRRVLCAWSPVKDAAGWEPATARGLRRGRDTCACVALRAQRTLLALTDTPRAMGIARVWLPMVAFDAPFGASTARAPLDARLAPRPRRRVTARVGGRGRGGGAPRSRRARERGPRDAMATPAAPSATSEDPAGEVKRRNTVRALTMRTREQLRGTRPRARSGLSPASCSPRGATGRCCEHVGLAAAARAAVRGARSRRRR